MAKWLAALCLVLACSGHGAESHLTRVRSVVYDVSEGIERL
jgi:hypothetical protein